MACGDSCEGDHDFREPSASQKPKEEGLDGEVQRSIVDVSA